MWKFAVWEEEEGLFTHLIVRQESQVHLTSPHAHNLSAQSELAFDLQEIPIVWWSVLRESWVLFCTMECQQATKAVDKNQVLSVPASAGAYSIIPDHHELKLAKNYRD